MEISGTTSVPDGQIYRYSAFVIFIVVLWATLLSFVCTRDITNKENFCQQLLIILFSNCAFMIADAVRLRNKAPFRPLADLTSASGMIMPTYSL